MFSVFCFLFSVFCFLFSVFCFLFSVFCFLFSVFCVLFSVFCLCSFFFIMCHVLRIHFIRHGQSHNNVLNQVSHAHFLSHRICDPPLTRLGIAQAMAAAEYVKTERFVSSLKSGKISKLLTSAHIRALMTALPIGVSVNVKPSVWIQIHEYGAIYKHPLTVAPIVPEFCWHPLPSPSSQNKLFSINDDTCFEFDNNTWTCENLRQVLNSTTGITANLIKSNFPAYELKTELDEASQFFADGWWDKGSGESKEEFHQRVMLVVNKFKEYAENLSENEDVIVITHGDFLNRFLQTILHLPMDKNAYFVSDNSGITVIDVCVKGKNSVAIELRNFNGTPHLTDPKLLSR